MQIYLFSCIFLVVTGMKLSYQRFGMLKFNSIVTDNFLSNTKISTICGIGSVLFGILQILQPDSLILKSSSAFIVGDIIPALFNLIGGGALLIKGFNKSYQGEKKVLLWIQDFVLTNLSIIGLLMVILGVIHALFPAVWLL